MLRIFKVVAFWEGISLLALLFFAMPMKYMFHDPIYVTHVGRAHGFLFVAYIIMAVMLKFEKDWDWKKFVLICVASCVPFGTFYTERKYLRTS